MNDRRKNTISTLGTWLVAIFAACSTQTSALASDKNAGIAGMNEKLDAIVIPTISFKDTPVRKAFAFLQQQSKEHDQSSTGEKGVQFVLKIDSSAEATLINLDLQNMRLRDAIKYTCTLAGLKFQAEPTVVLVAMQSDPTVSP